MSTPDDTADVPTLHRSAYKGKTFSLGKGAAYLGLSKGTLRTAIERGEVEAHVNDQGHYTIPRESIFQYEQNRQARLDEQVSDSELERLKTGELTLTQTGALQETEQGANPRAVPEEQGFISLTTHNHVIEVYKEQVAELRGDKLDLKEQSKKWEQVAQSSERFLTHEKNQQLSRVGWWPLVGCAAIIVTTLALIYAFVEQAREAVNRVFGA